MVKKVIITGITGQDGSNMVRYLLSNIDLEIYGTIRHHSNVNHFNFEDIKDKRFKIISLDITDQQSINNNVKDIRPDYIINFASQSFVGESWNQPILTFSTNTLSVIYFLEAIREYCINCRFYSAGSSEEFGDVIFSPQDLTHPKRPRSPYGASKASCSHIVKVYRESYNLYAIHSILFNHEGTKRGKEFVTRKITSNIARIKSQLINCERHGTLIEPLVLGNLNIYRDWSDSEDFVEAIWLMLNQPTPQDYLLSSNECHSIKEFLDLAFEYAGLKVEWHIDKDDELKTYITSSGQVILKISKDFYRPAEVDLLYGNSDETRKILKWEPKTDFKSLVKKMVDNDIYLYNKK